MLIDEESYPLLMPSELVLAQVFYCRSLISSRSINVVGSLVAASVVVWICWICLVLFTDRLMLMLSVRHPFTIYPCTYLRAEIIDSVGLHSAGGNRDGSDDSDRDDHGDAYR